MEIRIINLSKGPSINNADKFTDEQKKDVRLEVTPRLRYAKNTDYLGFQLDIIFTCDDKILYRTGFLIGMAVKGWKELLDSDIDLLSNREKLIPIAETAWMVATGVVAEQTALPGQNPIILPPIITEDFIQEITLQSNTPVN